MFRTLHIARKRGVARITALMLGTVFIGTSAGLGGCAHMGLKSIRPEATHIKLDIPEPPQSETPHQTRWAKTAPERLPSIDWVEDFNDPALMKIVSEALAANTDIRQAAARLKAAEAGAKSSRAGLYPSLDSSARISHTENANGRIPGRSNFSLGPSLSWEVDLWGRIKDTAKAGDIEADIANADYAATRLSIVGAITQTWFNLIEARQQRELAARNVKTQTRALRLTKRRFDGGVSGSSDYRLARSALANAQASLAFRTQNEKAISRQLETLLRRYPEADLSGSMELPDLPPLTGVGRPKDIFLRRADILSAERRMIAQGLRIDVAKKDMLPRLRLSADGSSNGRSFTRLFNLDSLLASIAAGLTAPVFKGGALKANLVRNQAQLEQLQENYADTVLTAYREVENALDAEALLAEREQALKISLEEARKAEERLEQRFSEGLASILQLLDSQTRRNNAESQFIAARKERLANRVRLHLALGGGVYGQEPKRTKLPKPKLKLKLPK